MELRRIQIHFLNKFAHLYDSGVPLAEALEIASNDVEEPVHAAVGVIVEDLYRGSSLADAMARHDEAFGPEIVSIIRSGEQRGELGQAARSAADGLRGGVLAARRLPTAQVDTLLEHAGDARVLHLEPNGRVRIRTAGRLSDGGELDTATLGHALAQRAGVDGAGTGAFLWNDRLVRVTVTPTTEGAAYIVRVSAAPGPEPDEARAWREGRPGLLLVSGGRYADHDACLRSILRAFDSAQVKCVGVGLPVPEVLCVEDLGAALEQDPDVIALAYLPHDVEMLPYALDLSIRVVAAVPDDDTLGDLPHRTIRLGARG